jgi:hypothetical protein
MEQRYIVFMGEDRDERGMPVPFFAYHIYAQPANQRGIAVVASIFTTGTGVVKTSR